MIVLNTMKAISLEEHQERNAQAYPQVKSLDQRSDGLFRFRCRIHGVFTKRIPALRGKFGCKLCGYDSVRQKNSKHTTKSVRTLARQHYQDLYDLSLVEYVNYHTPVKIRCRLHGVFLRHINDLTNGKQLSGCSKCWAAARSSRVTRQALEQSLLDNGSPYTVFSTPRKMVWNSKVELLCSKHGAFSCYRLDAMRGCGCPFCYKDYKVVIGKREWQVQGYERFALPKLIKRLREYGCTSRDLFEAKNPDFNCRPPRIDYNLQGTWRSHYPDFWVPKLQALIEIKSTWTAGLVKTDPLSKNKLLELRAKKRGAEKAGYIYHLLVYDRKTDRLDTLLL